jgi:hypothetical protein
LTRLFCAAAIVLIARLFAACGGDDDGSAGACGDAVSLAIVSPMDGAAISMAHDVDPAMGGLQIEIAVHACNVFSTGSQIEVWETESLMSRYAVLDTSSDDDVARANVPLVPGSLTFEARTVDGTTTSDPVSVTVTLP